MSTSGTTHDSQRLSRTLPSDLVFTPTFFEKTSVRRALSVFSGFAGIGMGLTTAYIGFSSKSLSNRVKQNMFLSLATMIVAFACSRIFSHYSIRDHEEALKKLNIAINDIEQDPKDEKGLTYIETHYKDLFDAKILQLAVTELILRDYRVYLLNRFLKNMGMKRLKLLLRIILV
jgi:hypothetical protein